MGFTTIRKVPHERSWGTSELDRAGVPSGNLVLTYDYESANLGPHRKTLSRNAPGVSPQWLVTWTHEKASALTLTVVEKSAYH